MCTSPRWASTMPRTRKSPKPDPASCSYPSGRQFGYLSNTSSRCSAGIPGPSSITSIVAAAVLDPGVHVDRGVLRRELRRVVHQLANDLDDPLPVERDLLVRHIQLHGVLPDVGGGDALTDGRSEPLRPDVVGDGARVDLQRRGRLRDRGEKPAGFLLDEPQELASLVVVQAVVMRECGAREPADGADRTPDLVRDHGRDLGPAPHDLLRAVGGAPRPERLGSLRGQESAKSARTTAATRPRPPGTTSGR